MFRSLFQFLSRWFSDSRPAPTIKKRRRTTLQLENLEDRWAPAIIAGYIYNDFNDNGLMGPSEQGIANQTVQLYLANSSTPIATTTTDSNGHYEFTNNPQINGNPQTITQTLTFNNPVTGESATDTLNQFDPSLGTLTSIDIVINGSLTSDIKIENTDGSSGQVTGNVSGNVTLNGMPDVTNPLVTTLTGTPEQSTVAANGTVDFGPQTVTGAKSITLDASQQDLSAFIGTGTININEAANSTSQASGPGNIIANIVSSGNASVQVVYHYSPNTNLLPGDYKVVEVQTPPGYLDGQLTNNNITPIPNSVGQHEIDVQLTNNNSVNNDFGAIQPASLAGYVYYDVNNTGVRVPGEIGISGSTIQLTGTNDIGQSINLTATTGSDGSYSFSNLRPGTYTLSDQTQPAGYLDGKATIGSQGGTAGQDVFSNIVLSPDVSGINNNFGKTKTSTLSGEVYSDLNNSGVLQSTDPGIDGVTIQLTGTTTTGQSVSQTQVTANGGLYSFTGLLPGTYSLTKLNTPTGYIDGTNTIGTEGGTVNGNTFSDLQMTGGTSGTGNNFGELQEAGLSGFVYDDSNDSGVRQPGEAGIGNVNIQLTGTTITGQSISLTRQSSATDGSYSFTGLQPGTYTLTKLNTPTGYIDGKDTAGSQGGVVGTDSVTQIVLNPAQSGVNNNFGMFQPSTLSGYTYLDSQGDGTKDPGDPGITNVRILLTGTDMNGMTVNQSVQTDAQGFYQFSGLLPGTYTISQVPAVGYLPGQENIGTAGGTDGLNQFFINLGLQTNGQNYDFGYLKPPPIIPNVPPLTPIPTPTPDPSKFWLMFS